MSTIKKRVKNPTKELIDPNIENYLEQTKIPIRLAFKWNDTWPYVISLWFIHLDGKLYCATQESAKVVQRLKQDNHCAYEIASEIPPYKGVRGRAVAEIDKSIGLDTLKKLLHRYLGGTNSPLAKKLLAKAEDEVAIILTPKSLYHWDFTKRMKDSI